MKKKNKIEIENNIFVDETRKMKREIKEDSPYKRRTFFRENEFIKYYLINFKVN